MVEWVLFLLVDCVACVGDLGVDPSNSIRLTPEVLGERKLPFEIRAFFRRCSNMVWWLSGCFAVLSSLGLLQMG
jgi:hypothetical protein